jgi:cytochrome d ubiquinol oxidase subunit II
VRAFRRRASGAAIASGVLAFGGLFVLHSDAPDLYSGLTHGWGLVLVLASAVAGVVTLALVERTERFGLARISSAAAVVFLVAGWAVAQQPYMLPGHLTIDQAAAGDATLQAVLISTGIAVVILGPSIWLLFRLVLAGRLDQDYAPLDQRFRPLDAGEGPSTEESRS